MIRSTTFVTVALAASLSGALAAQTPAAPPKPAHTAQTTTPKPVMHKVKEAQPGLLKQAKITPAAAEQTALNGIPGGKVTSREIERQKGVLVYAFHVRTEGQQGYQLVTVDATTGTEVSSTHEMPKPAKPTKKPGQ